MVVIVSGYFKKNDSELGVRRERFSFFVVSEVHEGLTQQRQILINEDYWGDQLRGVPTTRSRVIQF
jgi:hypothetical protein